MDLGGDVVRGILRVFPTLFKVSLATGLIFPLCLYFIEFSFDFDAPLIMYIISWLLAAYIFIKNSSRWLKNYFSS